MQSLQYKNKRDKNGRLLKYSAYKLAADFVNHSIETISKYKIYKDLSQSYNKQYIEFYFRKLIFYEFLPIAHQLVIKEWDYNHNHNNGNLSIDASTLTCNELLKTFQNIDNSVIFDYKGSLSGFQFFKRKYRNTLKKALFFYHRVLYSLETKSSKLAKNNSPKIAVFLVEGLDLSKRSDIFWLSDSKIKPSSVLIYFSLKRSDAKPVISELKKKNIQWVNLRGWSCKNKFYLKKDAFNLSKKNNFSTNIQDWLNYEVEYLLNNINYWYSFFKYFKIKVHSDKTEYGLETIVKQISLEKLNGISFVSQRSNIDLQKGLFYAYYPVDIFFSWGLDSVKKIKNKVLNKENPKINSIVISGCQHIKEISKNEQLIFRDIKNRLQRNGAKTVVLFLDSNHMLNESYMGQTFDTRILEKIYFSLLSLVIDNKSFGLILKPKKMSFFTYFYDKYANLFFNAEKTGRLYIERDFQFTIPSNYARISDLVLGIGSDDIPASILECAILNKPAVIFDYVGLSVEFYSWAKNKVIFQNVEELISEIKLFIGHQNTSLGEWDKHIDDYDFFQDKMGYSRVGFYLNTILEKSSNSALEKFELLEYANEAYSKNYENEKIIYSD